MNLLIVIYFEIYHQKYKLCKYADKTGICTIPMHLNDSGICYIQEFVPKYEILQEFPKQVHICIYSVLQQQGFHAKFKENELNLTLKSAFAKQYETNN